MFRNILYVNSLYKNGLFQVNNIFESRDSTITLKITQWFHWIFWIYQNTHQKTITISSSIFVWCIVYSYCWLISDQSVSFLKYTDHYFLHPSSHINGSRQKTWKKLEILIDFWMSINMCSIMNNLKIISKS